MTWQQIDNEAHEAAVIKFLWLPFYYACKAGRRDN